MWKLDKDKKVLIVGLGLLGGSYAEALTDEGFYVGAITRSRESIDYALDKNLKDYDINNPDIHIDFRRVRNLKVFFDKYLEKLTIDASEIEIWQPGDIVIYTNHIAIVSDKRTKKGEPYIIHHGGQIRYEENALTKKGIKIYKKYGQSKIFWL